MNQALSASAKKSDVKRKRGVANMTENVKKRLEFLLDCGYRKNRADGGKNLTSALSGLHPAMRNAQLFKAAVDAEKPVLYKEDLFGFNRFNRLLPVDDSVNKPYIFKMGNITADYETLLEIGRSMLC